MKLACPGCKAEFEHIESVNIDGLPMLRIGTLLIREAQGVCMECGRVIYWSLSNHVIAQVIKAALVK
jgi:hypothetical protein